MKTFLRSFLITVLVGASIQVYSQDCPEPGVRRYEAKSFVRFAHSFSLIAFRFNGEECTYSFWHFNDDAYFDVHPDGSALLHGSAYTDDTCDEYDGQVWNVHVSFLPTDSFDPYNPVGEPDTDLWEYFVLDPTDSYLSSKELGETVTLTQRGPGAQMGQGANDKTDTFGFSTWFFYTRADGYWRGGDINIDLDVVACENECTPEFRTQTPGGWGAKPRGNNPGAYLHANFDSVFPEGLTVGCDNSITFSSAQAITDFLPSGGKPIGLTDSYIDPTSKLGTLAGHTLALALSLEFDMNDANFGGSESLLSDAYVTEGSLQGWTVQQVFDEANNILGACSSEYSTKDIINAISMINESFVDGERLTGFLSCDSGDSDGDDLGDPEISFRAYPNPTTDVLNLDVEFENKKIAFKYTIYDLFGNKIMTSTGHNFNEAETQIDLSQLKPNRYIIRIESVEGVKNISILKR